MAKSDLFSFELGKYLSDAVLLLSQSGTILNANAHAAIAYGYSLPELLGKDISQLHMGVDDWQATWETLTSAGELRLEIQHPRSDGDLFPVEINWKRIEDAGQEKALCIMRDISERKAAERQIVHLKDVYAALSQTNQCIVRVDNREELFRTICQIAIQFGHLQLAWIGIFDEADRMLKPVAWEGAAAHYLDGLQIPVDPASPLSKGPAPTAFSSGQPAVLNNLYDSKNAAWQAHGGIVRSGLCATASFPLFLQGRATGILSLYSNSSGYFTQELLHLLVEMAGDISFALDRMRAEEERKKLDAENQDILQSLARLKDTYAALSQTNQCIVRVDNREELFRTICQIAIQFGHMQLAWIGIFDEADRMLKPVAWEGAAAHYLDGLLISADPASPLSKSPVGTAFRTGQPSIVNDMQDSKDVAPWHAGLVQHGLRAAASFPLFVHGRATGVLSFYSSSTSYFTQELLHLFAEMAGDISFALDRMEMEAENKRLASEREDTLHTLRTLRMAVEQSPVTVAITDTDGNIQYVNPAFTVSTGYAAEEVLGKNPNFLKSGETPLEEYAELWDCIRNGITWSGTFHNKRKNGSLYWEEAIISPVRDAEGTIIQYISIKQDITLRREAEERARFLALHDPLTRLPNRLLGKSRMEDAMRLADENHCKAALLFIDVDQFKRVNDWLGHTAGDQLLQALGTRLKHCIRATDTLSRQGGDEFLIILSAVDSLDMVHQAVARIQKQAAIPFRVDDSEVATSISIGVAIYPDDGNNFEELRRHADLAMYCAKKDGRNTSRIYTRAMETESHEYLQITGGLREALDRNEFVLYYQPQLDLASGQVVGAEALIRWRHPELGLLMPSRFISIAESNGLIEGMGAWVLQEACRQLAEWQGKGHRNLTVAVNLSALQLRRGGFSEVVRDALAQAGLEPKYLELELTESMLIHDSENAAAILKELKSIGVGLALDDFGTGYSSLSYLKNFYLDKLKIDQSFVHNIAVNKKDETIVRSITQLAKNFGLVAVAEGVEDKGALEITRRIGCDQVQGFFFAKPMDAENFLAYLNRERPLFAKA